MTTWDTSAMRVMSSGGVGVAVLAMTVAGLMLPASAGATHLVVGQSAASGLNPSAFVRGEIERPQAVAIRFAVSPFQDIAGYYALSCSRKSKYKATYGLQDLPGEFPIPLPMRRPDRCSLTGHLWTGGEGPASVTVTLLGHQRQKRN